MDFLSVGIVGQVKEFQLMIRALEQGIPVILEGEAGTGKTEMAKAAAKLLERPLYRVDGDQELSSMKLQGWFDPPLVIKNGYGMDSFIPGPLCNAMEKGGVFLFNEVNRAPSECVNGTLTAIDERQLYMPRLGAIKAAEGFTSIFTCNPLDRVGTNPLPQAFFDRCVWIGVNHQPLEQAKDIVRLRTNETDEALVEAICRIVEASRTHKDTISGGSIRAAIFMVRIAQSYRQNGANVMDENIMLDIANAALLQKVKLRYDSEITEEELIHDIVRLALGLPPLEKKTIGNRR